MMKRKGLDSLRQKAVGSVSTKDVRITLTSDEAFDYSSYRFAFFDPGLAAGIDEPFYASSTVLDVSTKAATRDGKQLTISVRSVFSVTFLATTSARDIRSADYKIDLACTRADSFRDLETFVSSSIIPGQVRRFRQSLGFWEYLGGLLFRNDTRKIFLIFQRVEEFRTPLGSLFGPKSHAQVEEVRFNVLSWNYLFY
jgi:hypothetical protein